MATTSDEPWTPVEWAINGVKMLFALSPLLGLGYVLMTAFEDDDAELRKRSKKTDFNMEGHSE
eukprot:CAMPEP_0116095684 /NCGR_PEP_ID=MMETSP0327-20121206/9794_1 /TAXON_ID=44447 /ORGANISM="Pseudo-nitzschia delicatissima, Strain B596" /LENGTH=62 /DNA_ID=CAMNT_0003587367 /DNA_START=87 /DNA_END=275 /DNA_ORIENTATION=+